MVRGKFRCLGSLQHIKEKYGDGYEIEIKFRAGNGEQTQGIVDWANLDEELEDLGKSHLK